MAFAPVEILVTGQLKNGSDLEEFYCPGREWDWGDGTRSAHESDCEPGVERALAGLDIVVIPSTCRECGSLTLIESLCLGVPVVASDIGGNPEMLREGEDGLLVPPGDPERLSEALVALATNHELRRGLAAGALATRSRFDSLEVARRAAAVLRMAAPGVVPATNALQSLCVEP
jgi:glycosyltransferase involved in cell wall biosynthesis